MEFFPLSEGLVDFKELDRAVLGKDQVSLYLKAAPEYLESLKTDKPLPFAGVIVADGVRTTKAGPLKQRSTSSRARCLCLGLQKKNRLPIKPSRPLRPRSYPKHLRA